MVERASRYVTDSGSRCGQRPHSRSGTPVSHHQERWFRETHEGEVTGEQVRPSSEMRGFATDTEADTDKPATEILREKHNQGPDERETQFSTEE